MKFSHLGDHVLPIKLRSEHGANDLNHFQLKVPPTFSIAEIIYTHRSEASREVQRLHNTMYERTKVQAKSVETY